MRRPRLRRAMGVGAVLAAAAVVMAACGSSSTTKPAATTSTAAAKKIPGGVAVWAQAPQAAPNYILPFMPLQDFSVSNINEFQALMFRPLYWFGTGNEPTLNPQLSLADPPVYSNGDTTVTVTLKGWKWSNGETVDARDVLFWMNMLKANATSWAAYVPGAFPDNVTNVVAKNNLTVVFTLNKAYNPYWFTYNELSQVTPLPIAWDITSASGAPGSGGCSSASYSSVVTTTGSSGTVDVSPQAKACAAVLAFLSSKSEAGDLGTYATNPLWQIVDGPWHLVSFDPTTGDATFVPNPSYSGTPKPTLSKFEEVGFTSDSAEYVDLEAGKIDVGYLPSTDISAPYSGPIWGPNGPEAGPNVAALASSYTLSPLYSWGINYFPLNFTNPTVGPIFKQLYVRQALQHLINQPLWIKLYAKGYAAPTYGPVPVIPPNNFATSFEEHNPYPYSVSAARQLLTSHGWSEVGGVMTCEKPGTGAGECGAGIPKGAQMNFTYIYASGVTSFTEQISALQASWAQVGIKISPKGEQFSDVIGTAVPCTAGKPCPWEIANWGGGWSFAPDYYPTGGEIFATGAGSNSGGYSDPTNDRNIALTHTSSSLSSLYTYEDYLAKQLPVLWQPNGAYSLTEIKKDLCGVLPQAPTLTLTPEFWYHCSAS
jgi:peptide/nickel transport system substrate-binding protein